MAPILDATLPRLLSDEACSLSRCNCEALPPLSGLDWGLSARFPGRNASFNLRAGDGDLCCDPSVGARSEFFVCVAESGEARMSVCLLGGGDTSPSACSSMPSKGTVLTGTDVVFMRGDDVVR